MDWWPTLVGTWGSLAAVAATAVLAYALLVLLLRLTGKRTLSRMNAFDLVVTVSLGTMLGTTIVSPSVSWLEGMLAIAVLVILQWIVAHGARVNRRFDRIIKARPALLVHEGRLMDDALRRERVSEDEVWAAARKAGIARQADVAAILLESDGELSVIGKRWDAGHDPAQGRTYAT